MIFFFDKDYIKDIIKEKIKEKKKKRDLNILKNVILKNIVTKKSFNTFYLIYLTIFLL